MTTCAECRYHHDRGCYIAPVSVFRQATAPACAQIATIAPQDAPGAPERARGDGDGPETVSATEATWRMDATRVLNHWHRHLQANPKENDQ